jgi:hypothetical protein
MYADPEHTRRRRWPTSPARLTGLTVETRQRDVTTITAPTCRRRPSLPRPWLDLLTAD